MKQFTEALNPRHPDYEDFVTINSPLPCSVRACTNMGTWAHVIAGSGPQSHNRAHEFSLFAYCHLHAFAEREIKLADGLTPFEQREQHESITRFVVHMLQGGSAKVISSINAEGVSAWRVWLPSDFEDKKSYDMWHSAYAHNAWTVEHTQEPSAQPALYAVVYDEEYHSLHLCSQDGKITPPQNNEGDE